MKLALSMIVKDEVERVDKLLKQLSPYIDVAYITITDRTREQEFRNLPHEKVEWNYFAWRDDFAAARNANLKQIHSDFFIWLDADDTVEHPEKLRELCAYMEQMKLDALFLPYDYMQNEAGETIAWQERERLIRTSHPFKWKGAIHESLISEGVPHLTRNNSIVIHHDKKIDEVHISSERNHKILLREYKKEPRDPRITYYLGTSFFMRREYDKAIEKLIEYISTGGWDEEKYRAWCKIAEAHIITDNLDKAMSAASAAENMLPDYPEALWIKAQVMFMMEEYEKCIAWLKKAIQTPQPKTMSVIDPTKAIQGMIMGAMAYSYIGDPTEAFGLIQKVLQISPYNSQAKEMYKLFEYNYLETKAVENLSWLAKFYEEHGGKMDKLLLSIPGELYTDPRMNELRAKYAPVKEWGDKEIAIFCGPGEVWGPDTLDKGMGGSEEAIVYLSRELAKLGWQVTVFNERDESYTEFKHAVREQWQPQLDPEFKAEYHVQVTYKPWQLLNPNDKFNIFVAWRAPEILKDIKAKKRFVDVHDVIGKERVEAASEYVDLFLCKSRYHRELYLSVPDSKFAIIGNGIAKDQFK